MGGKPRRPRARACLSDPWRRWVFDALLAGASPPRVVEELISEGVPRSMAESEVDVIAAATTAARARLERLQLASRLFAHVAAEPIARRPLLPASEFFPAYFAGNRPVVFTDGCRSLIERGAFRPERLAERFGDARVSVSADRESIPDHYVDAARNSRTMKLSELLDRLLRGERSNDLYLVSQNRALEGPLAGLLAELRDLPDFLDPDRLPGRVSLWLGPAGTFTPLHHDTTNVFFCQLHGRKRFRLVAPLEPEVLLGPTHETFYSDFDPGRPGRATVHELELAPGESLFLPVGWWHQVEALAPSVSLSFTCFRRADRFEWYRPGARELP